VQAHQGQISWDVDDDTVVVRVQLPRIGSSENLDSDVRTNAELIRG